MNQKTITVQGHWQERWNSFWFGPSQRSDTLRMLRTGVAIVAALWFFVAMLITPAWFSPEGWSSEKLSRALSLATEGSWSARFRVSPLWLASSTQVISSWCMLGMAISLFAAVGIGAWKRAALLVLGGLVLCLAQRWTWGTGAFEPYVIALLCYLAIAPGSGWIGNSEASSCTWQQNLAIRLIQVHTTFLLVATCAHLLSSPAWWSGEAIWWLASTNNSTVLSVDWLQGKILLVNAVSHLVMLASVAAPVCVWLEPTRKAGIACAMLVAITYALIADQILYGALLAVALIAFRPSAQVLVKQ